MLLNQVTGATCYQDIKTYNNSFKDAWVARGILGDENEWHLCLQEAAEIKTGGNTNNLSTCDVIDPYKLLEKNIEFLYEDILYRKRKKTNNFNYKLNTLIKKQMFGRNWKKFTFK